MPRQFGRPARSGAFAWYAHRITGTFLLFLLITHFWVQHYDRRTASITHSVVTPAEASQGVLPRYPAEAADAVRDRRAPAPTPDEGRAVPAAQTDPDAGPSDPGVTPHDVLMLRLGDPVYAVLWKAFNLLFLLFALHHGFHGLSNILTDYIRNDMLRVVAVSLSWTVALVLLIVGSFSVVTAGL